MRICSVVVAAAALFLVTGCQKKQGKPAQAAPLPANATPKPEWVSHVDVEENKLCGVGVAGAGFDESSPYPKEMSSDRAARNLAGVIQTKVEEAIIDRSDDYSQSIDTAQVLTVDDELVQQVKEMAKVDFWLDVAGEGPFLQANFTYARACVDAKIAAGKLKVDPKMMAAASKKKHEKHKGPGPAWLTRTGIQPGGRLCAVGFSLPTFFPEKTFEVVVDDVRAQLAEVLQTLVSQYSEEIVNDQQAAIEMMTVATTQAISKGAIVTDYWYDEDGVGPNQKKRSTYGWGCVYPVDVMKQTAKALEKELPEKTVAKVRERAAAAFDDLDKEIEKREGKAGSH